MIGYAGSALASCAAVCACQCCQFVTKETMRRSARLAYCVLFTLAMLLAWVLRDFAKPLLEKIPCKLSLLDMAAGRESCLSRLNNFPVGPGIVRHSAGLPEELSEKWYGQQAVYRVSMGNFVSLLPISMTMTLEPSTSMA